MRARSEADVRRAAQKLEDALRCASLPDAGARVLLVRRLDLGPFAADASAQTLSRLIEQKVAAAGGTWLHATDADAAHAGFVYFHDALEARTVLALRLAEAAPCSAWYWPLAVPEFDAALDAPGNLRRIAQAIAGLPEAPAAVPAWIARLSATGAAPAIARAMTPADVLLLLNAAHVPRGILSAAVTGAAPPRQAVDSPPAPDLRNGTGAPPHAARPQPPAAPPNSHRAGTDLPAWWQILASAGGFVPRTATVAGGAQTHPAQPAQKLQAAPTAIADAHDRRTAPEAALPHAAVAAAQSAPAGADHASTAHAAFTRFGGLLFMLTLLQRLNFAAWVADLPQGTDTHITRELLTLILQRLQAPPDDPAWQLTTVASEHPADAVAARAPACWLDPALAAPRSRHGPDLAAAAAHPQPAAVFARLWLTACRRWLRRRAGIGISSLITRPAALSLSATHADVYFQLNATDLRVRRAGLDVDPGWVAWFGRVVSFHYTQSFDAIVMPGEIGVSHGR